MRINPLRCKAPFLLDSSDVRARFRHRFCPFSDADAPCVCVCSKSNRIIATFDKKRSASITFSVHTRRENNRMKDQKRRRQYIYNTRYKTHSLIRFFFTLLCYSYNTLSLLNWKRNTPLRFLSSIISSSSSPTSLFLDWMFCYRFHICHSS